jgi:hypothetical protein
MTSGIVSEMYDRPVGKGIPMQNASGPVIRKMIMNLKK